MIPNATVIDERARLAGALREIAAACDSLRYCPPELQPLHDQRITDALDDVADLIGTP